MSPSTTIRLHSSSSLNDGGDSADPAKWTRNASVWVDLENTGLVADEGLQKTLDDMALALTLIANKKKQKMKSGATFESEERAWSELVEGYVDLRIERAGRDSHYIELPVFPGFTAEHSHNHTKDGKLLAPSSTQKSASIISGGNPPLGLSNANFEVLTDVSGVYGQAGRDMSNPNMERTKWESFTSLGAPLQALTRQSPPTSGSVVLPVPFLTLVAVAEATKCLQRLEEMTSVRLVQPVLSAGASMNQIH